MRVVCVDDEVLLAQNTAAMCRNNPDVDEAVVLTSGREALEWFENNDADIAILDIDMPDISGLQLAARVKTMHPDTKIIFLTGFSRFAVDAFKLRASGYLLKPVDEEELAKEIEYAASGGDREKNTDRVVIHTFGSFDVFADGSLVTFRQKKCKELLAVLVDRQGGSISRPEAFAMIYEDRQYDRQMQKLFDNIIRSMRDTLREYDIDDIFEMKSGQLRICPEIVSCDLYRLLEGDTEAVNRYRGEYMSSYSWAEAMEGFATNKKKEK
jgi:two-component SAPR family response regulator